MKFACFSDLHIHRWSEFANGDDRLNDCISVLSDVRAYCIEHQIKHCVFGGDLFHRRGVVYTRPYAQVANELLAFKDAGIAFYAAVGNHDQEDHAGDVHALQPLMAGGLIIGVGRKGWRTIKIGDCGVTLFSYCDGFRTFNRRIAEACADSKLGAKNRIGVFHHGFKGAKVGSALEYVVKEPIDAKKLKLDKLFGLVLSGHYHAHQSIVGVRNGWYIGSPLEHTRSDRSDADKGFLVVDTKTLDFSIVPLRRPRFVPIAGRETDCADVKGNFVDVIYKRADELEELLTKVRQLGARGVNPVAEPQAKTQTKRRLNVSPTLAPNKVLKRYVKHRKKDIKQSKLDRSALLALGLDLIAEAEGERK